MFTFHRQKAQVIGNVDTPQFLGEFDAINDARMPIQINVLRPQVAMTVDDFSCRNSLSEYISQQTQVTPLLGYHASHSRQLLSCGREQRRLVGTNVTLNCFQIVTRVDTNTWQTTVELCQMRDNRFTIFDRQLFVLYECTERP